MMILSLSAWQGDFFYVAWKVITSYVNGFPFSSEETKFKKEVHDSWQK